MKRAGFRIFKTSFKTWDTICCDVAGFVTEVGPDRLITVSHSCDHGEAVTIVWYWEAAG